MISLRRMIRTAMRAAWTLALLAAPSVAIATAADGLDAQTKAEIQSVITKQLDAIAHDDAKGAEEFAAPGIREKFPEPSKFLDMVKSSYGALIHPKSTQFTQTAESPHGPLQEMTIVAADGTVWSAIYSFQKVDGAWRITGCGLQKDDSQRDI